MDYTYGKDYEKDYDSDHYDSSFCSNDASYQLESDDEEEEEVPYYYNNKELKKTRNNAAPIPTTCTNINSDTNQSIQKSIVMPIKENPWNKNKDETKKIFSLTEIIENQKEEKKIEDEAKRKKELIQKKRKKFNFSDKRNSVNSKPSLHKSGSMDQNIVHDKVKSEGSSLFQLKKKRNN